MNEPDTTNDKPDDYIDIHEVARMLKSSSRHVNHLMNRRLITYMKDGSHLRFRREHVHQYMDRCAIHARN